MAKRAIDVRSFQARASMLVLLLMLEALAASLKLDGGVQAPRGAWITDAVHAWGASAARFAIAFSAMFATFSALRERRALQPLAAELKIEPLRPWPLAAHAVAMGLFAAASLVVYREGFTAFESNLAAAAWIVAAGVAIAAAALAFFPAKFWKGVMRATGRLALYSGVCAAIIAGSTGLFRNLWKPASEITFHLVRLFLSPFVHEMVIQPDRFRIGTPRFTAIIDPECSGLEGVGLLIVFGCLWLFLFREEARFPQAFVLVPLGVVTLFLLNGARIAALVLIGDSGAKEIAKGGFHSQAGWILFNSVAFGSAVLARRWSWISVRAEGAAEHSETSNATAAYLMPFLAILGAGMISRMASGSFEWLYSLRFFAALGALWLFRRSYSDLNWSWSAAAPLAGLFTFLVWIAAELAQGAPAAMPAPLASAPGSLRAVWIALRIAAAVFTVPIAEELAFRGYLMRRLTAADFEAVGFHTVSWFAVAASSAIFGLMHQQRWIAGCLAGLVFGIAAKRTGRIGDAVIAHAVANALIAIYVLHFGAWELW